MNSAKRKLVSALVLAGLNLATFAATASTITFSGLTGNNGTPFIVPYGESGFTVTPVSGIWSEAHFFGNPIPDIFATSSSASVEVTTVANGLFRFTSVDLADAGAGGATYSIVGMLGGATVFSFGDGPLPNSFLTISNPNPSDTIDALFITMNRASASYNIDNIVVQAIPEPTALTLGALGVTMLMFVRRSHKCKKYRSARSPASGFYLLSTSFGEVVPGNSVFEYFSPS